MAEFEVPGGGGAPVPMVPLSNVRYVDGGLAPATPTGSIGEPFPTVTAGEADLAGAGALKITPRDYSGEATVSVGNNRTFSGLGSPGETLLPVIDSSASPLVLSFENVDVTYDGDAAGQILVLLSIIRCTAAALAADVFVRFCYLETANAGLLRANGSVLGACTAASLGAVDCTVLGALNGTVLTCEGCFLSSTVDGGTLSFENCNGFLDDVTATVSATFFTSTGFAAVTIDAPIINMDATSYANAIAGGVTFTNPVTFIDGSDGIANQSAVPGATATEALDELDPRGMVLADATTEANAYRSNTDTTTNYTAINGADFENVVADADWSFAASTCAFTYNGPSGKTFLITLTQNFVVASTATFSQGIDINGDVIGTAGGATTSSQGKMRITPVSGARMVISSQRLATLNNGDVIKPAGALNSTAVNVGIRQLTLSITGKGT